MSDYKNYSQNMEGLSRISEDIAEQSVLKAQKKVQKLIEGRLDELYTNALGNYTNGTATELKNLDAIISNKANSKEVIDEAMKKKETLSGHLDNAREGRELRLSFEKKIDLQGFIMEMQKEGRFVSGISAGAGQYYATISDRDSGRVEKYATDHGITISTYKREDISFLAHDQKSGTQGFRDVSLFEQEKIREQYRDVLTKRVNVSLPDKITKLTDALNKNVADVEKFKKDNKDALDNEGHPNHKLVKQQLQVRIDKQKKLREEIKKTQDRLDHYKDSLATLDARFDERAEGKLSRDRVSYDAGQTTYTAYMDSGIYTTDAGRSQQKVGKAMRKMSDFITEGSKLSTAQLRMNTWSDLAIAQREIQNAEKQGLYRIDKNTGDWINPLTGEKDTVETSIEKKYKSKPNMLQYKPLDDISVQAMLTSVGKEYGVDLLHSKNLTKDTLEIREKLLNKYALTVKLDKKGNIDQKALMDLVSGKKKKFGAEATAGAGIPTLEEAKFLCMTMQASDKDMPKSFMGMHPVKMAKKVFNVIVSSDGYDSQWLQDMEKLETRAKQTYKVTKSATLWTKKNIKYKIRELDINRTKNLEERINNLSGKEKEKLEKKRDKRKEKTEARNAKLTKIQEKRAKKLTKKEKRQNWYYTKTPIGRLKKAYRDKKDAVKKWLKGTKLGKGIDLFRAIKTKLLIFGAGGIIVIMLLSAILTGLGGALSVISSFFEANKENQIAFKMYENLLAWETDWNEQGGQLDLENMSEGNSSGWLWWESLNWNNINFTKDYISAEQYFAGNPNFVYHKDEDNGTLFLNCFGFETEGKVGMLEIDGSEDFDEDLSSWTVLTAGNSSHTSNIKDILCMMDVIYGLDLEGNNKKQLQQYSSDHYIIFEIKNGLSNIWNRIKCIGNIFGLCDDPYANGESMSYFTLKEYCKYLFTMSHQETIELVAEQKYLYRNLDGSFLADGDSLSAGTPVCPEPKGCGNEEFYISDSGDYMLKDVNGNLQTAFSKANVSEVTGTYTDSAGNTHDKQFLCARAFLEDPTDTCAFVDAKSCGLTESAWNMLTSQMQAKLQYEKADDSGCWDSFSSYNEYENKTINTYYNVSEGSTNITVPTEKVEYVYDGHYAKKITYTYDTEWVENTSSTNASMANVSVPMQTPTPIPSETEVEVCFAPQPYQTPTPLPEPAKEQTMAKKGDKKKATSTPKPTATPKSTKKPKATATPKPTKKPTATPKPTSKPTSTPKPTNKPTNSPTYTVVTSTVTQAPTVTGYSGSTSVTPEATATPTPEATPTPVPTYTVYIVETKKVEGCYHNCDGDHDLYYCKGHVGCVMTGEVFSFSQEQIEGGENGVVPEPKLENIDYSSPSMAKVPCSSGWGLNILLANGGAWANCCTTEDSFINFSGNLRNGKIKDLFDVDLSIDYGNDMFPCGNKDFRKFLSWNGENQSLAILKYTQDWYELYKFDIPENIGGKTMRSKDIFDLVKAIKESYARKGITISEERETAMIEALKCIGNATYSMKDGHHDHGYHYKICNGKICNVSDCSGFASYILLAYPYDGTPPYIGKNTPHGGISQVECTTGLANTSGSGWGGSDGGWVYRFTDYTGESSGTNQVKENSGWWKVRPADVVIHSGGHSASEHAGGPSHALVYIGMVDEVFELSNGQKILANCPIIVECTNTVDSKLGNIYLTNCLDPLSGTGADGFTVYYSGGINSGYILRPDDMVYIRKFNKDY